MPSPAGEVGQVGQVSQVGDHELAALFRPFEGRRGVLLAVSGGSDSTALMVLARRWQSAHGGPPLAVATIDHGLRAESAGECAAVGRAAAALGLACRTLRWVGPRPVTRLQERAREARLALLAEAALDVGADAIALGHTLDDQAETVLMRIARGSGVDGVAAMRRATMRGGLALLRPLLGIPRERLVATLRDAGQGWTEDPSNADPRFARVRVRQLLTALEPIGLSREGLALLAERAARAADGLEATAAEQFALIASETEGEVRLDAAGFMAQEPEIRLRLLARSVARIALQRIAPERIAPERIAPLRLERLEALAAALSEAIVLGQPLRRTLGGALISAKGGSIRLAREAPRRRGRAPPQEQS